MVGEIELTTEAAKRTFLERIAARIHDTEAVRQYAEAYKLIAEAEAHESAAAINRLTYRDIRRSQRY
jgi:hypothetical protein